MFPAPTPTPSDDDLLHARRCSAIVRSAVDFAVIATDVRGVVTDWNPGAEKILGWSQDEMRGRTADCIFTPEDRAVDRVDTEMRCALQDGRASDERWHLRKDASRFWASGELMPLRAEDGTHIGFLKILRDFTAQREAAEQQRLESEFMRGVLASSGDCIEVLDLDAKRVYMSEGGQSVMEVDDFAVVRGCPWPDFWEDDGNVSAVAAIAAARAGRAGHFQNFANTFKGRRRFWDVQVTPILGRDGLPERLLAVSRDITGTKEAERRLALSQERLDLALGASDMVGIWDWDLASGLLYADARFARFYGVEPERGESGAPIEEYLRAVHPDDLARIREEFRALFGTGGDYASDYRVLQPDGTVRWVSARGKLVRDAEGKPLRFPGASVEITARKQAETTVREANELLETRIAEALALRATAEDALRQSQKMEAVGQLTGGLAHDFNNLLASISGSFDLLRRRLAQARYGDLDRYIDIGRAATERAAALTHRLLAFSRRQTLDPKPTSANRLVQGMEELIRRTVGPEIRTALELEEGLWPTLVDPHQQENALLNLCINARDAMPFGGHLLVKTANRTLTAAFAAEAGMGAGDYVALDVTDSGSGMSAEVVQRVFEPFFTTKPLGMGTGLGLSMVYGFAKQSGGEVRIASEPGLGTSVCIYLPRHAIDEAPQGARAVQAAPRGAQGETVLVVDDESAVRMLILDVLQDQGYTVLAAADGDGAMSILRSEVPVDLLVTDVGLPGGMNGRQIADAARVDRPGLPVLFVTGYAEGAMSGEMPAGMHLLAKPFSMDLLSARVRALIPL
ncbi:PAS domain S-box protein [Sphingomonas sp. NCPPB 2930]